jgi:hypothetical protein
MTPGASDLSSQRFGCRRQARRRLAQAGRERTKGIVDALEEGGIEVIYQEIDDATNKDPAAGVPFRVMSQPDIKLVPIGNLTGKPKPSECRAWADDVFGSGPDLPCHGSHPRDGPIAIDQRSCRVIGYLQLPDKQLLSPACRSTRRWFCPQG